MSRNGATSAPAYAGASSAGHAKSRPFTVSIAAGARDGALGSSPAMAGAARRTTASHAPVHHVRVHSTVDYAAARHMPPAKDARAACDDGPRRRAVRVVDTSGPEP